MQIIPNESGLPGTGIDEDGHQGRAGTVGENETSKWIIRSKSQPIPSNLTYNVGISFNLAERSQQLNRVLYY